MQTFNSETKEVMPLINRENWELKKPKKPQSHGETPRVEAPLFHLVSGSALGQNHLCWGAAEQTGLGEMKNCQCSQVGKRANRQIHVCTSSTARHRALLLSQPWLFGFGTTHNESPPGWMGVTLPDGGRGNLGSSKSSKCRAEKKNCL